MVESQSERAQRVLNRQKVQVVVECVDNVCRLADMFMCPKRASVPAEFVAIQTEIGHVNRLKEQWIGTIGSGDVSATHLLIVESLLLGTSQSILSRMISGESGQISVELGVADAA